LREECVELEMAIGDRLETTNDAEAVAIASEVLDEAVDVANFAMMIADCLVPGGPEELDQHPQPDSPGGASNETSANDVSPARPASVIQSEGAACAFCDQPIEPLAADPGLWPLVFAHPDGTGIAKTHHVRCVTQRLFAPSKRPSFEELWKLFDGAFEGPSRMDAESRCKLGLRAVLAALPATEPVRESQFAQLRRVNVQRCESLWHPLNDWNVVEWAACMAGEAGEACNIAKKLKLGGPVTVADLAKEIADVTIYADLLAASQGISLWSAIVHKFNEVSERKGSDIRLEKP